MNLYNWKLAFKGHRSLGLATSPALLLALASACSGVDATDLASSSASTTAVEGDSYGLTLIENSDELVAGTFSRAGGRVDFELSHDAEDRVLSIHAADGAPLLHTQLNADHERVELGSDLKLDGPPGSLFAANGPTWDRVTITGDHSRLGALTSGPDFALVRELGAALAQRTDVAVSLLDGTPFAAPSGEAGSEASLGVSRQPLDLLSAACVNCQLGCSATYLSCALGKSSWTAWIICAPANAGCHFNCVGSSCQ